MALWNAMLLFILVVLFVGMVGAQLLGHHVGARRLARDRGEAPSGKGSADKGGSAVEASLFALLGLLVAFTFSGAQDRLNIRRQLIIGEANAIGTAYLRLDLLPAAAQPMLQEEFRHYVDTRLAYYKRLLDFEAARENRRIFSFLQQQIWKDVVAATADAADNRAALLLIPAVNEMIDVTTARDAALRTHVPLPIFLLLVVLALSCSFFAGLGMAKRPRPSRLHLFAFAATMAATAYVILDLEFPRIGLARLDAIDALLVEVRAQMK